MNLRLLLCSMLLSVLLTSAAGCATSPPVRLYALEPTDSPAAIGSASGPVAVGTVRVPERLRRKEIVEHRARYRVNTLEFDRWAEPLEEGIARVVAENLSLLLATDQVYSWPWPAADEAIRVDLQILEFGSSPDGRVVLLAVWNTSDGSSGRWTQRSRYHATRDNESIEALVAAMSACLVALSREIATTIVTVDES